MNPVTYPTKSRLFALFILIALVYTGVYSCRKNSSNPSLIVGKPNTQSTAAATAIQQAFADSGYQAKSFTKKVNDSLRIVWKPDWAQMQERVVGDSSNDFYVPMKLTFFNFKQNVYYTSTFSNFKKYLVVHLNKNGMAFVEANYLPDSGLPVNNKQSGRNQLNNFSFSSFTGVALFKDLNKGVTFRQVSYVNSQKRALTINRNNTNGKANGNKWVKNDDIQNCYIDHFDCEWSEIFTSCVEFGVRYDPGCTLSGGGGVYQDPQDGCTYTLSLNSQTPVTVCETIVTPDLPPGPALIAPANVVPNTSPCNQKATIGKTAADATLTNLNTTIRTQSTVYEYGANQNLTSLTSGTYKTTAVVADTPPSVDSWAGPPATWDSTNGFTIGTSHDHPGGSAPSPDDVFSMLNMFSNPDFAAAGATASQFYQKNAFITVLTANSTFVVTVNNWNALNQLAQDYFADKAAFQKRYQDIGNKYVDQTPASMILSPSDPGEYALKKVFGSIINLYKAPKGSNTFTPRTISSSSGNSVIANLKCP